MKNCKRGVSAIEITISFLLFLGFLTFIFMYMNPLQNKPSLTGVESLSSELEKNLAIEMNSIGLKLEGEGCFQIKNPFSGDVFALDENGESIELAMDGEKILLEGGKNFYYVYDSADTNGSSDLSSCKAPEKHSWSVQSKEKVFSYSKIEKMNESYHWNYNSLKNILRVPVGKNFAIIVYDESRSKMFEMKKSIPKTEIISLEYPVEILKGNQIQKGAVRISEW